MNLKENKINDENLEEIKNKLLSAHRVKYLML
jgi:hypothetical protein